jgi:hypothetical protein
LRDIRGNDYYDRVSLMIKEWAELGMVLPVQGAPASLPIQGLRVEQGRNHKGVPIDVTSDAKYHLTANVEDLFPSAPSVTAQAAAASNRAQPTGPVQPPPKRRYRQGEI